MEPDSTSPYEMLKEAASQPTHMRNRPSSEAVALTIGSQSKARSLAPGTSSLPPHDANGTTVPSSPETPSPQAKAKVAPASLEKGKGKGKEEELSSDGLKPGVGSGTGWESEMHRKPLRTMKKRADIQASIRERLGGGILAEGKVWVLCCANEIAFDKLLLASRQGVFHDHEFAITSQYSEVLFCRCFGNKLGFCFKFGCIVGWGLTNDERARFQKLLTPYFTEHIPTAHQEDDEMDFVWSEHRYIKQDTIHLVTSNHFERLAYSYAFAQSVKLSYFEQKVDNTIDRTKAIPEGLARTGTILAKREDISKRIGELFISRFYINLHTDILDTPDIFWESDEFQDHYSSCRTYLEIPKRVDILNQRLDIIKDLYDMLNDELTIQHGHRLEWIVIYLICMEVAIELIWNILIRDILKLV